MTEKINVEAKTKLNRAHAIVALFFWIIVGILPMVLDIAGDVYGISILIGGIVIGIIRLFMINDKYAWQVATLEEIRELKDMIASISSNSVTCENVKDEADNSES